jgi:hypothetical protein
MRASLWLKYVDGAHPKTCTEQNKILDCGCGVIHDVPFKCTKHRIQHGMDYTVGLDVSSENNRWSATVGDITGTITSCSFDWGIVESLDRSFAVDNEVEVIDELRNTVSRTYELSPIRDAYEATRRDVSIEDEPFDIIPPLSSATRTLAAQDEASFTLTSTPTGSHNFWSEMARMIREDTDEV